jgi:D-inositol-3-phosphate glycosyltransferase
LLEKRIGVIMYQTSNSKGQELVAQRMVRDFNKLGHKAYLITGTFHDGVEVVPGEGLLKNKGYYCIEDEALHIPVIRVDSSLAKWPPRRIVFKDFINTLNQIVDDFSLNVLITHSTLWNGPEDVVKFITWRRDMRNIGGYRDPMVFCHMSHFQEPSSQRYPISELTFRTAWNKISLPKILEVANVSLVVTPYERKAKIKMGAKPEKCLLYPGGVDNEVFLRFAAEDTTEFFKQHNIAPGTRIVSYLGTLEERKNPLAILKVAEKLKDRPDIHFVLAGKGDSDYGSEVISVARNLPNVSYLGEISEREKALLIRSSYLNILLSRLEALGITQLEFMYAGVPVITSAVGGQSWVVQNGIEGLHTKGANDIDGAADAITHLIDHESIYRIMSINARERAGKYASINLTSELDSAINRELVKESGLSEIPVELGDTLTKPEYVLKSWSAGTSGLVATNRRIFIRRGLISKSVLGMRYDNIKSIEHLRRYSWKILLVGLILTCLALFAPSWENLLAQNFVDQISNQWNNFLSLFPPSIQNDGWFQSVLPLLPLMISVVLFLSQARTGFRLYIVGTESVYLPGRFKKAIEFIRQIQDTGIEKISVPDLDKETLEPWAKFDT